MRIDLFLLGYVQCEISEGEETRFFELCHTLAISPKALKRDEKTGVFRFFCTEKEQSRLQSGGASLTLLKKGGLPHLVRQALKRPAILCGVLAGTLLLLCSQLFLFDVRVEGGGALGEDELQALLSEVGLSRGAFLPHLDEDEIALSLRQRDARIAYAAVNLRGNVARVQLREAITPPCPLTSPANLVAKCDGVVMLPLVFAGQVVVQEGEIVRAGQLLASGILDSEKHGYRVTRAAGEVLARTTHTYTVRVPFSYCEKVATGKTRHDLSLLFFGVDIKLFKTTGNMVDSCDIIENIKWITLPQGAVLPIGYAHTRADEYTWRERTRSAAEARTLAHAQLQEELARDSVGRTLLSSTVEEAVDAEGITLYCTVVCEENIAAVAEFEIKDHP